MDRDISTTHLLPCWSHLAATHARERMLLQFVIIVNFWLVELLLYFSPNSHLNCWGVPSLVIWKSAIPEGWLLHVVSMQEQCAVLLEDKELTRNLTQQHFMVICTVNLHPRINKYHIHFPQLGHTHGHHQWRAESQTCPQQKFLQDGLGLMGNITGVLLQI